MTSIATRPAHTAFTLNRIAKIGLVSALALTLAACATRQQRNDVAQDRFGDQSYVVSEHVSENHAAGTTHTVSRGEIMYQEVIGGLSGARLTSPATASGVTTHIKGQPGLLLSKFDTQEADVYCTTETMLTYGIFGYDGGGCLIDTDRDGAFDRGSRPSMFYDGYNGMSENGLDAPATYEEVQLEAPQFATSMELRFGGMDDQGRHVFLVYGRLSAGSVDQRGTALPAKTSRVLGPNANVSIDGVQFTVLEYSESSITYRLEDTRFDVVQFTDWVTRGTTRRPVRN